MIVITNAPELAHLYISCIILAQKETIASCNGLVENAMALEASLADQALGGQRGDPTYTCLAPSVPRIMNNYEGAEFVITPETTHVLMEHIHV